MQISLLQRSWICLQTFPATYLPREHCLSHRKATAPQRPAVISSLCLLPVGISTKPRMVMTVTCAYHFSPTPLSLFFSVQFPPLTWSNILKLDTPWKRLASCKIGWKLMKVLTEKKIIWQKGDTHPYTRNWECTTEAPKTKCYYGKEKLWKLFQVSFIWFRHEHPSDHIQGRFVSPADR